MPRFAIGQAIATTTPTIVVDPGLPVGAHRFQLEVIDGTGLRSAPAVAVISLQRLVIPPPGPGPTPVPVPGPGPLPGPLPEPPPQPPGDPVPGRPPEPPPVPTPGPVPDPVPGPVPGPLPTPGPILAGPRLPPSGRPPRTTRRKPK